ncbi:MAG: shikimate kinase [Neomegalonema sp.]|nr:shikimate kinase [Neomegalonema sp.]
MNNCVLKQTRTVALVGLMGAGKSAIGRRLANVLHAPFRDADDEIVRAAGMSIAEIFERFGEPYFREGERRVIARLLADPVHVLATGGGAFMDPQTRDALSARAITVWLKADLDTLVERCSRRDGKRPLLKNGDVRETLSRLMSDRYPIYEQADVTISTGQESHGETVRRLLDALDGRAIEGWNAACSEDLDRDPGAEPV